MTVHQIYDQTIKKLPANDRLRLAKLIIDDLSLEPPSMHIAFDADKGIGDFGGRSLADLMQEIGFAEGGSSDTSENPEKYMQGFGETKNLRAISS